MKKLLLLLLLCSSINAFASDVMLWNIPIHSSYLSFCSQLKHKANNSKEESNCFRCKIEYAGYKDCSVCIYKSADKISRIDIKIPRTTETDYLALVSAYSEKFPTYRKITERVYNFHDVNLQILVSDLIGQISVSYIITESKDINKNDF